MNNNNNATLTTERIAVRSPYLSLTEGEVDLLFEKLPPFFTAMDVTNAINLQFNRSFSYAERRLTDNIIRYLKRLGRVRFNPETRVWRML